MFELLENFNNKEHVNTANENITIEHIFPQTPNEDWEKSITPDDYFMFKEKYLNTIANLTLSGNNGALSNRSFADKKSMNRNEGEQGYIYSRLWLNDYLKKIDHWDVAAYEMRFELIYNRFLRIWEYPNVTLPVSENTDEQNIFDAESPTHKKLEYFIFQNTKVEMESVAQMYFYVVRNLYEKNSQLLLGNQELLKITRSAHDFRAPQEVINGWFIESNIDSNSKFSVLKRLLSLFEMEDELYVKYLSGTGVQVEPNRFAIRKKYWQQLLPLLNPHNMFTNVNPSKEHWLSTGAGIGGLSYTIAVTRSDIRIELTILTASQEKNKMYFNRLLKNKEVIEQAFGKPLAWEELPENKMSRIKYELLEVSIFNESDWGKMNEFFVKHVPQFENAFRPFISNLR